MCPQSADWGPALCLVVKRVVEATFGISLPLVMLARGDLRAAALGRAQAPALSDSPALAFRGYETVLSVPSAAPA
jgi:hypothetical protein